MLEELGAITSDVAGERIRYQRCELVSNVLDALESGHVRIAALRATSRDE